MSKKILFIIALSILASCTKTSETGTGGSGTPLPPAPKLKKDTTIVMYHSGYEYHSTGGIVAMPK